jgi:hypothetical protein
MGNLGLILGEKDYGTMMRRKLKRSTQPMMEISPELLTRRKTWSTDGKRLKVNS